MSNMISFRLDDYELSLLEKEAKKRKVNRSALIKEAIKKLFKPKKEKNKMMKYAGVLSDSTTKKMFEIINDSRTRKEIVKL